MLWHLETLLHAIIFYGVLIMFRLWFVFIPLTGAWLYFSIQKIGA